MLIENARFVSPAEARQILAPALAPHLAARRLDIALLKDLLLPSLHDTGEVLLLPDGAVLGELTFDAWGTTCAGRVVSGVVAQGALTVKGDILNDTADAGPFLAVLGNLRAQRIYQSGMTLVAAGLVTVVDQISCDLSRGSFRAYGGLRARELIIGDERLDVDGTEDALRLVLMDVEASELLLPDLFYDEACPPSLSSGDLSRALRARIKDNSTPLQPPANGRRVG